MKVVFFAPRMHTNTIGWSEALIANGVTVIYHVCYIGQTECHQVIQPHMLPQSKLSRFLVKIFGPGDGDIGNVFPSLFYYLRLLRKEAPHILVVRNPLRFGSLVAIICGKLVDAKILIYTQSRFDKWSSSKISLALLFVYLIGGAWFSPVISPEIEKTKSGRFCFLPFVVGQKFQNHGRQSDGNKIRIVTVGKYKSLRKNHDLLLQALKILKTDANWSLEIIGECYGKDGKKNYKRLIAAARGLNLKADIKFKRNIPHSDMPAIFSRADLFILPASNEPAAISVLEAMASGVPVICSDSCGTKTYVEALMPELIFKSDDVNDLSRKIEKVIYSEFHLQYYKNRVKTANFFSHNEFIGRLRILLKRVWGVGF